MQHELQARLLDLERRVVMWLPLVKHCAALLRPGLPADGTIAAEVAFMFNEWYKPDACLEFPRGGSQAIVNALVRCAGPPCTHPWSVPCSL